VKIERQVVHFPHTAALIDALRARSESLEPLERFHGRLGAALISGYMTAWEAEEQASGLIDKAVRGEAFVGALAGLISVFLAHNAPPTHHDHGLNLILKNVKAQCRDIIRSPTPAGNPP